MEESSTEKKYDHEKSNIPAARKADDFDRQNDRLSSACASLSWLIIRIRPYRTSHTFTGILLPFRSFPRSVQIFICASLSPAVRVKRFHDKVSVSPLA